MRPSKRDELVQKALEIFYLHGFHATGMDKLVAEIGISKTSIYNHFRTKEDLILATLRLRDEKFRHWLYRRMEALGTNPIEQLVALFDALNEWFKEPEFRGCMFIKASSEYQDIEHPIHKQSADHKHMLLKHITQLTTAAQLHNPKQLASQLLILKEGAIVSAQLCASKDPATDAKQAAIFLIEKNKTNHK